MGVSKAPSLWAALKLQHRYTFYHKNAIEYFDEYEYIRIQRNDKHSLRLFYVQDYYSSIKRRKL